MSLLEPSNQTNLYTAPFEFVLHDCNFFSLDLEKDDILFFRLVQIYPIYTGCSYVSCEWSMAQNSFVVDWICYEIRARRSKETFENKLKRWHELHRRFTSATPIIKLKITYCCCFLSGDWGAERLLKQVFQAAPRVPQCGKHDCPRRLWQLRHLYFLAFGSVYFIEETLL
jgi:hypothetical protein